MIKNIFLGALAALALASGAQAQTFGQQATALSSGVSITNANGTNPVAFEPAAGNGQKITGLYCSYRQGNTILGSAITVELSVLQGGVTYPLGQTINPASAGNISTAGLLNLLQSASGTTNVPIPGLATDSDGNSYLPIEAGSTLQIRVTGAVASGNTLSCVVVGQKY